jgi:dCMP deaminase
MTWDEYHLQQARGAAAKSKDPSTKVGARIVDFQSRLVSEGFNGPPRLVNDDLAQQAREIKLRVTLHAELNAILFARQSVVGYTLYVWPLQPCTQCAAAIIQVGISRVVTVLPSPEALVRWGDEWKLAREMFQQAEVQLDFITI